MPLALRTLIVDDNSTNLKILARTLKHHFSTLVDVPSIVQASDGYRALEEYRAQDFDMILLDIDMPGISGVEVAQEIRKSDVDIIIIACTTSDSRESRATYNQIGMDGCVCKPLNLRELTDCMLASIKARAHLSFGVEPVVYQSRETFLHHLGSPPTSFDSSAAFQASSVPSPALRTVFQDPILTLSNHGSSGSATTVSNSNPFSDDEDMYDSLSASSLDEELLYAEDEHPRNRGARSTSEVTCPCACVLLCREARRYWQSIIAPKTQSSQGRVRTSSIEKEVSSVSAIHIMASEA